MLPLNLLSMKRKEVEISIPELIVILMLHPVLKNQWRVVESIDPHVLPLLS
jgi:hypothetical protein